MRAKILIAILITLIILPVSGLILLQTVNASNKKITHSEAVDKYKSKVEPSLSDYCQKKNVPYPPEHLYLVGLKAEKELRIYAPGKDDKLELLHTYEVKAASGEAGPKLKEGDWQVPEGFYKVESFNPNSRFHLSLRVNYPNQEDKKHALAEKRTKLGGDIMIHGGEASIGCIAIGDDAIEELYVLVSEVGRENVDIILAPCNLANKKPEIKLPTQPEWLSSLYTRLSETLKKFPV